MSLSPYQQIEIQQAQKLAEIKRQASKRIGDRLTEIRRTCDDETFRDAVERAREFTNEVFPLQVH